MGDIDPGDDPNFSIEPNEDGVLRGFDRNVVVFGTAIYAVPGVDDAKLLHAANLMAQYLDNDEDGAVDNEAVTHAMRDANAFMVMWAHESDLDNVEPPEGWEGQDLGDQETQPGFVAGGMTGRFDAALEEVLHIITHAGYARAYPDVFGEVVGTSIADAMDLARGGRFESIPASYPEGAWYSYDDPTCDYACMVTEYHYWALTSRLGAQANRLDEISQEWRLNTRELLASTDTAIESLLADPQYAFPTTLPDGTYRH